MSNVFLRCLVENGFCGKKIKGMKFQDTVGYVHHVLDRIVAMDKLSELSEGQGIASVAGRYGIPYANQPQFEAWARGLNEKLEALQKKIGISASMNKYESIDYVQIESGKGHLIEPAYQYIVPDHYVPIHSLMIAHIMAWDQVKVTVVPVLANELIQIEKHWSVDHKFLSEMLANSGEGCISQGFQCVNCHGCKPMGDAFEQLCSEWLEAKQKVEEKENLLREFLAFRGPTKYGNYIVFLKEHRRRFFRDKDFPGFLAMIMSEHPKDYHKFLNPDASEVAKAVEQKLLPESIMAFFKESRYTTIESGLTI